jgi:rare lipoprotein A
MLRIGLRIGLALGLAALSGTARAGERGLASYYSGTAAGQMTCAHRTRPIGSLITVTNGDKSIRCRVTDRGPFKRGRVIDVSVTAARALGMMSAGVVAVTLE